MYSPENIREMMLARNRAWESGDAPLSKKIEEQLNRWFSIDHRLAYGFLKRRIDALEIQEKFEEELKLRVEVYNRGRNKQQNP